MEPSVSKCSHPSDCNRPVVNKKYMLCNTHYIAQQRKKKKEKETAIVIIPAEVIERLSKARTQEDWQELGAVLTPVMAQIMAGTIKASAAQVSLIKDVMNRAYGKPVATQSDSQVATGVVVLPALDTGASTMTCPNCMFTALKDLHSDTTKELAKKVLKELLERLLATE